VTGLADLRYPGARSWQEAYDAFTWPLITRYNIAEDCLSHDPRATALIAVGPAGPRAVSYGELGVLTGRLAGLLRARGVRPGDRVAVKLPQSAEMALAVLAALRAGAIVVTVSDVLGADAVRHRLTDSAAAIVIAAGTPAERALAASAGVPVLAAGGRDWPGGGLDACAPVDGFPATAPDDAALLLYTSGTTGAAKGVLHGHRVLLGHHAIDLAWDHVRPGDVAYSPVDWSWAGGLMLGLLVPLALGITVVAYRETRFDPASTVELMRATGVSVGMFPPTALRMLRRSGRLTGATMTSLRLRALITGAEAVEPELLAWARDELGVSLNNAFGQTEANAILGHAHVLGDLDPACLGRPYPGHAVAVLDEDHSPVGAGQLGELAVRADDPVCMLGYWNAPEAIAVKCRDGWLLTGDLAHVDADQNLHFHGRADDLIKSGGYRIGPAEVEAALLTAAEVGECAVVGLPDPERGQAVTAFIRLGDGHAPSAQLTRDLQARVRARVGAHAYPRRIEYVTALPRTGTGKVNRRALRTEQAARP
jgi:acetyl-CoA synthetase